jgi:glycosyltransferase involved in cell wall biosynthesis
MDYRPNVDAVLWFAREVLPLVTRQAPDVRVQIVGMNPHPRLDELRGRPDVEITGAVADTRSYIHASAAYVIPMRIGGGTRFKALEAMACGVAIVSTRLGVEGIPVRDGEELLLADEPEAFARQVLRLLEDLRSGGDLRRRIGRAARVFVEQHYGWGRIVPPLNLVYERVVQSS